MSDSNLKQIARRFYEAFNQGNLNELEQVLKPDWIIHPAIPGEGSNLQKYQPIATALLEAFPDVQFSVENLVAENDIVAVRAVITGTQKEAWLGVSPAGQRISVFAHDFHRIEGNQIAESWHVEDWLLGIQQMNSAQ